MIEKNGSDGVDERGFRRMSKAVIVIGVCVGEGGGSERYPR